MIKSGPMNIIVACNQASRLPTDRTKTKNYSLILSPRVLAEIFLRSNPHPTLERIRHYHFKIGLDIADVMSELISRQSSEEITSFEPFYAQRKTYQQNYEGLIEGIYKPTPDHATWASRTKTGHRQICATLTDHSLPARKEIRKALQEHQSLAKKNMVPAEGKPSSYQDILPYETPESSGFIFDVVSKSLFNYGCEPDRVRQIYRAVLSNQYLGKLFRSLHAYALGRAGGWKDQKDNFSPSTTVDDVTDILLPLYAGDGDAIVTEDTMITRLLSLVEVGGAPVTVIRASNI
jgi:hypothetical protein